METDDVDKKIEAFVNEHFMSTWLTESPAAANAEDFFDSLLLTTPDDLLRLSPKIPHLPERPHDYCQDQPPPSSSSPTLPPSVTSTSIDSTGSSSSHVLSSFRSARSLRRLKISGQIAEIAPRPYSASFSYDDDPVSSWPGQTNARTNKKLEHVIQELIDTEKVYYHDLLLIEEIYMASPEASPWTEHEKKSLFGTLLNVLDLEKEFLLLIEASGNRVPAIGKAFLSLIDRMEQVYCAYCKRHHDVIRTLNQQQQTRPAVAAFLKRCTKAMAGRTTSWDLGSLLIKPVQRILKYPLLLQEMVSLMSPPDPDLAAALDGIQRVADRINETKRRKDMVDSIVGGKTEQSSVECSLMICRHGINKSLARNAYRLKKATGLAKRSAEGTSDAEFDRLHQQFEDQQHMAHHLVRECLGWVQAVKHVCLRTQTFAVSADTFYDSPHGPIREFSQVSFDCIAGELEHQAQKWVDTRIQQYLSLFNKPSLLIDKRARKRLDHERNEEFLIIHAQLVEDLPRFLELAAQFFDIVLEDWSALQSETYQRFWQEWLRLARMLPADDDGHDQGIVGRYRIRMKPLFECLDRLVSGKRASIADRENLLTWEDFLRVGPGARSQDID